MQEARLVRLQRLQNHLSANGVHKASAIANEGTGLEIDDAGTHRATAGAGTAVDANPEAQRAGYFA